MAWPWQGVAGTVRECPESDVEVSKLFRFKTRLAFNGQILVASNALVTFWWVYVIVRAFIRSLGHNIRHLQTGKN